LGATSWRLSKQTSVSPAAVASDSASPRSGGRPSPASCSDSASRRATACFRIGVVEAAQQVHGTGTFTRRGPEGVSLKPGIAALVGLLAQQVELCAAVSIALVIAASLGETQVRKQV
jgi:hypothetical protein